MAQGVKNEQKAAVRKLCALRPAPCNYPFASICGYLFFIHRGGSENIEGRAFFVCRETTTNIKANTLKRHERRTKSSFLTEMTKICWILLKADKNAVVAIYNSHTEAEGIIETTGTGQTATHLA